jgi:hypothetical protein
MSNTKVFRIGHRAYKKNGVITIASEIDKTTNRVFYGVSFCSPRENIYYKKMGNEAALLDLATKMADDDHIILDLDFTHPNIVNSIIQDLLCRDDIPRWSSALLFEQIMYPVGLHRSSSIKNKLGEVNIHEVVVDSALAKTQLMLACQYLQNSNADQDFTMVAELLSFYLNPDRIIIREKI